MAGMNTLADDVRLLLAQQVRLTKDSLQVELSDGRSISVPLSWYPRLAHATPKERAHWRLIGRGEGIHWPHLDEDVSVENLLSGKTSGESQASFQKWLDRRSKKPPPRPR